ncbi:hypothetical protein [Terrihabitans sp. B22-R8]|uniref:hypothetical protein n=1 Tax=Terrihabitans sp. B22-R8 TaxID=3425128 RepID=UPI00403D4950
MKAVKSKGASDVSGCIDRLVEARQIKPELGERAKEFHRSLVEGSADALGRAPADAVAAIEVANVMLDQARQRKLKVSIQATQQARIRDEVLAHPKGVGWGASAVLAGDPFESGVRNVESQIQVVERRLFKHLSEALEAYKSRLPGAVADSAGGRKTIQELRGVDTGDDVAKRAAVGFRTANEEAVKLYRANGGLLHELGDWRSPQFWDSARVREFGDDFERDILDAVSQGALRIWDKKTYAPAPADKIPDIVRAARDAIQFERGGTSGAAPGFGTATRVFRFQDNEAGNVAFFRLMDKYGPGTGGYLDMMIGHLKGAAREVALVQIMGPDHAATAAMLKRIVSEGDMKKSGLRPLNPAHWFSGAGAFDRMYRYLTGELNAVESSTVATIFGTARTLSSAANLGSAVVSAVPGDTVTAAFAANHNGLPMARVISRAMQEIVTENADTRATAARLNVTSHALMDHVLGAQRFDDEVLPRNVAGRAADAVMRLQGLNRWTNSIKRAFEMEFLGLIADQSGKGFAEIDPKFRGFLERHRFREADWETLRSASLFDVDGAKFWDADAVEDRALSDRMLAAIFDERRYAVIESGARTAQLAMAKRGTLTGEFMRSSLQFKSFPLTMIMTHGMRLWLNAGTPQGAAQAVSFMVASTAAGALVVQAKSLLSGKDPRPMDDPKFWASATLSGGALGIYGDLLSSTITRTGLGPFETVVGPVIGEAVNTYQALRDAAGGIVGEEQGNPGRSLLRAAKRWTPGANIWWARLGIDRLIFDQVQTAVDPDYRQSFSRMQQYAEKEFGQSYWFAPGTTSPQRAPAFSE